MIQTIEKTTGRLQCANVLAELQDKVYQFETHIDTCKRNSREK